MSLRFLSVCSGIEAASVAWHPLGWKAIGYAEIEAFPSYVLNHHYGATRPINMPDPDEAGIDVNDMKSRRAAIKAVAKLPTIGDVPNYGDFTKIDPMDIGPLDILCGGTPCQAFSVAGMRESLSDQRGNLTLEFVRLAHELADRNGLRNIVWENVPGVLSTKDNAFGCFLGGLVGADDPIPPPGGGRWPDAGMVAGPKGRAAWRVLDAQYFGLAQRRRRVIVVGDFGNGADPAAVLFERASVPGNPAPSREARKDIAPTISARTKGGGGLGTDFDLDGGLIEHAIEVAPTLRAGGNSSGGDRPYGTDVDTADSLVVHAIQAGALRQNPLSGPDGVGVQEAIAYTLEARAEVQAVAYAPELARCVATREGSSQDYETTTMVAVGVTGDVAHTLKAEGADGSEDGTGRGVPVISVLRGHSDYGPGKPSLRAKGGDAAGGSEALICVHGTQDPCTDEELAFALGRNSGQENVIAFDTTQITSKLNRSNPKEGDPSHPLSATAHPPAIAFTAKDYGGDAAEEISPTLRAGGHSGSHANAGVMPAVTLSSAVRRLTPRECEALMGFPPDYTMISAFARRVPKEIEDQVVAYILRGNPGMTLDDARRFSSHPDGPRYKALGNSWAVPKFRWIGERIARLMPRVAA